MKIKYPSDEEIQKAGEELADEYYERSDDFNSEWWKCAENFTNGGRFVINEIKKINNE